VVIWAAAEGFGGPYTSGASDIGTAIIYALVFMCLLTLAAYTGPDTYSVDHYLEKKISLWHKIAELGRPAQQQPVLVTPAIPEQVFSPPPHRTPAKDTGARCLRGASRAAPRLNGLT
jgi:nitrite reductase (NO-forming)